MTDNNIKFVIIGSGNIANTYISAICNLDDAEVIGVVARSQNKPTKYENLNSYRTLIDIEQDYDAVIVCTPNALHHVSTIEAASLGKHVLFEKPIDISIDSIDRMILSCKENNVKLGVAYQRRFSSNNPIVKNLIDENKLGKIFSVALSIKNYRDDNYYNSAKYRGTYKLDGGGPFIQQASHYIDLYYWIFGKPNKLVSKLNTFVHNIEVEDHGAVICSHDSGMISTINASTATKPGFPAKMEIYSNKGYLILENDVITHWEIEGLENPTKQTTTNVHTGSSSASVEDTQNHEYLIKDFISSIKENKEPLITGQSAKNATEIILDIYKNQF
jgi:UDP-N-acetyl-2-amino-2-deoxyglucuronate dehydrogenase